MIVGELWFVKFIMKNTAIPCRARSFVLAQIHHSFKAIPLALVLVFQVLASAWATEIIFDKDHSNLGINVYPLEEQTWASKVMTCPGSLAESDRIWSGPDFFESEYGEACVFQKDWIKEYGYSSDGAYQVENGTLVFTTGPKGFQFGFGGIPGNLKSPSVRFGAAWGGQVKDRYRLRMVLDQDVAETSWSFDTAQQRSYKKEEAWSNGFKIMGKGHHEFEVDLGLVRECEGNIKGFKFQCLTPKATVKIGSIKIAPSSAHVCFRKKFTLPEKPILAHASFTHSEVYDLYVNGRKVDSGTHIYMAVGEPSKTVDLAPYLVAGENVIALEREFFSWSGGSPNLLFEGVAVDRSGHVTHILGDQDWKCSVKPPANWMEPAFDDGAWKSPLLSEYFTTLANGKKVATGINPRHMGMLDVQLADRPYPIFGPAEPPSFKVRLPLGVKGSKTPSVEVQRAEDGETVETVQAPEARDEGDFAVYPFKLKVQEPGAYRLIWKLTDEKGEVMETRREEMVMVGPIPQDTIPLANFESEFEKRLKLVQHIDCTQPAPAGSEFLDHAGMYVPPSINRGKVVTKDGMTYRETGPNHFDYFAYRLHLKARGQPHVVEIVIPDNQARYIYSGVVEQRPIPFCDNPGDGSRGMISATGTSLTGGQYPLSMGKRKLRYIYYPGSTMSAVTVMSGFQDSPAAACEINVYQVEGGLPAMETPRSDRMFGSHNERISLLGPTLLCENQLEMDIRTRLNGHRDAWYHWYKAFERKIRWLRFQGQNMAVEGIYMYNFGDYPTLRHNQFGVANQEFDPAYLMLKMYAQNNIHCLLGVEYMASPQVEVSGKDTLSDRKVWLGEASKHCMDRHGRQLISQAQNGINFLDPDMAGIMKDLIGEIYDRYHGVGKLEGLFMVLGDWWAPGFIRATYHDIDSMEVGYDDLTVSLFEEETHVKIPVSLSDPGRFQKRYEVLTGPYRDQWVAWRAKKLKEFLQGITKQVQSQDAKWKLYVYPSSTGDFKKDSPFLNPTAPQSERDGEMERYLAGENLPVELYEKNPSIRLVTPAKIPCFNNRSTDDDVLPYLGWNTNPGTQKIIKKLETVYPTVSLNEVDLPAGAAPRWIWSNTARGVFVARGVGDNCMSELVNLMTEYTPKAVFYSWLDCNMETAYGPQNRRFAKAMYVTPDVEFTPMLFPQVTGVIAQKARKTGGAYLRLVNNTGYPLSGQIQFTGESIHDMVYDTTFRPSGAVSSKKLTCGVTLHPNDIRLYEIAGSYDGITCRFAMDEKDAKGILQRGQEVLDNTTLQKLLTGEQRAQLAEALKRADAFAVDNVLGDFEVASRIRLSRKSEKALKRQAMLLEDLERKGVVRLRCANDQIFWDPDGNRWLPDQAYLSCGTYGNEGANFADRGNIEIKGTNIPEIYRNEAYGDHLVYRVPLPNGRYNVRLHFAETYSGIKAPGMRNVQVKVQGKAWKELVDPYGSVGFATALIIPDNNVLVEDGLLVIDLTHNVGISGIEIEKAVGTAK